MRRSPTSLTGSAGSMLEIGSVVLLAIFAILYFFESLEPGFLRQVWRALGPRKPKP